MDITLIPTNQGASDDDYSLSATSLTFGPTETSKTFTFTATQDSVDDDGESVDLTFGSPLPAGVSSRERPLRRPSPSTTTTMPVVEVNFEHSSYSVAER